MICVKRKFCRVLQAALVLVLAFSNATMANAVYGVKSVAKEAHFAAEASDFIKVVVSADKSKYAWDDTIVFTAYVENIGNKTLCNVDLVSKAEAEEIFVPYVETDAISILNPGEIKSITCNYAAKDLSPIKRFFEIICHKFSKLLGGDSLDAVEYPYGCTAKVGALGYNFGFNVTFSLYNRNPDSGETPGEGGLVDQEIGPYSNAFLGYKKDVDNNYYYCDDKDCWQKNAGYNEVYDNMAPLAAMFIDQVRIRFTYDHKDWMIQFWKGQYGWLLVGAEIGVYTAPEGTYKSDHGAVNQYICADKEDWLKMQLDCYFSNTNSHKGEYVKIFTRPYDDYWWANGFVKGQLTKYNQPRTELNLKCRITLKTKEMADAFAEGLRVSGFNSAASVNQLEADTYYQDGQDVYVLWSTIYHDCFVGYTD